MTKLQHVVTLDEKSVQKAAMDWKVLGRSYRPPRTIPIHQPKGMDYLKVHPLVMNAAKALIDSGSYTRIEIIDERTVMVR